MLKAIGTMTSRAEPEPRARRGCAPSRPKSTGGAEGGLAGREGLAVVLPPTTPGFLPFHPSRAELLPTSQMPQLPHPDPRTSENKEEMPVQPGLDGAGLRLRARDRRGTAPLGLAPPLLYAGSAWRCQGSRKPTAHLTEVGEKEAPSFSAGSKPATSCASE